MGSIAFSIPIKKGQAEHLFDHVEFDQHENPDHLSHGRSRGVTHARLYHQTTPHEAVIVYLEGPNIEKSLEEMYHRPLGPEEKWFELIAKLGDHKKEDVGHLPSRLIMDWHHERGHAHKEPKRKP